MVGAGACNGAAAVNPAVVPRIIIYDTFTGANGTLLPDHAPDVAPVGSAWVNDVGTPTIQDNRAYHAGDNKSYIDCVRPNGVQKGVGRLDAGTAATGFCFRYKDATDRWICTFYDTGDWKLQERVGASWYVRASVSGLTIAAATDYPIEVHLEGPVIRAIFNGVTEIAYSGDVVFDNAKHGLRMNGGAMDDYQFIGTG